MQISTTFGLDKLDDDIANIAENERYELLL